MDVLPNEEEQMVKNLAREFLEAECPPGLARNMEKDDLGYPPELWQKMADLGWLGMSLPEQYGGRGGWAGVGGELRRDGVRITLGLA